MALPADYVKDYQYLKGLSDKGQLNSNNQIYKKLDKAGKVLPEVRRALNELRVNYV